MKVSVAKTAGFCFGVKRAVEAALKAGESNTAGIRTFGPLIHNEAVVRKLEEKGIKPVEADLLSCPEKTDETVVIRAHGVSRDVEESLKERYFKVVDATCPFVKKIHALCEEHSKAGDFIIVLGSKNHPEVVGITGHIDSEYTVVETEEEARSLHVPEGKKAFIIAQTTFHYNKFQEFVEIIRQKVYDIVAENTICHATEERQTEAAKLAACVDVMLVLGDLHSSNSRKLYEICRGLCEKTRFLQDASDLEPELLVGALHVGITAGASTPHTIIEEVQRKCKIRPMTRCSMNIQRP